MIRYPDCVAGSSVVNRFYYTTQTAEGYINLFLQRNDLDVNAKDDRGMTALDIVMNGPHMNEQSFELLSALLKVPKLNVNDKGSSGRTPILRY